MIEQTVKLLKRIKETSDGQDFIEYLESLSKDNYEYFKKSNDSMNDICKGYAIAIDSLITSFRDCDRHHSKINEESIAMHY